MSKVVWFDIPVADMTRAIAFYEKLTAEKLIRLPVGPDEETAIFAAADGERRDASSPPRKTSRRTSGRASTSTRAPRSTTGWHGSSPQAGAFSCRRQRSPAAAASTPTSRTARGTGSG